MDFCRDRDESQVAGGQGAQMHPGLAIWRIYRHDMVNTEGSQCGTQRGAALTGM